MTHPGRHRAKMTAVTVVVTSLLLINILSGIAVITVTVLKAGQSSGSSDVSPEFEKTVKQIYQNVDTGHQMSHDSNESEQTGKEPGLEFLSLLKPIALFCGTDLDKKLKGQNRNHSTIRDWVNADGSERKLLYNGMQYEDGYIRVPATGLYRIYSHVKFSVPDNHKDDPAVSTFSHAITHYQASISREEVLFQNQVTECKDGINDGAGLEYPSDVAGVAHLNVGDSVALRVSDRKRLRHDTDWHYFGIYLI